MNPKEKDNEIIELTDEELNEIFLRSESENLTVFSSAFTRTMLPVGWMMNALR